MGIRIRMIAVALLCTGLTACAALLPAVMLPQLAVGVGIAGLTGITCANDPMCEGQASQCFAAGGKDLEVTVLSGAAIPAGEELLAKFAPAYWEPQFETESNPRADRAAETTSGSFAVTDKSVLFLARSGADGVRLPLAAIVNVEVQRNSTAAPRQLTVESCFGRLDRFMFGQAQQPYKLDSDATAAAAAALKARVAALRPATAKESDASGK
jgi:hypothetical protein